MGAFGRDGGEKSLLETEELLKEPKAEPEYMRYFE